MGAIENIRGGNAEADDMANRAWELRKLGATYEEIAKELGYFDKSGAAKAVKRYMARLDEDSSQEIRTMMVEQLRDMFKRTMQIYSRGDDAMKLKAQDQLLKIHERASKLLGLDAPTKVTGADGGPLEIRIANVLEKLEEFKSAAG